jgi:hypothetical protein
MAILDECVIVLFFKFYLINIQRNQNHLGVNVTLAKYDLLNKEATFIHNFAFFICFASQIYNSHFKIKRAKS